MGSSDLGFEWVKEVFASGIDLPQSILLFGGHFHYIHKFSWLTVAANQEFTPKSITLPVFGITGKI